MEDDIDPPFPDILVSATCVARRALILAAVVCCGDINRSKARSEEDLRQRVLEWLTRLELWNEVEPDEEKILRAPLGTLEKEDVVRATWYVEGLAILAWALNRLEFPCHDTKVDPYDVADSVWFLNEGAEEVIRTARLRDQTELEACDALLYAIHVRVRDFMRHRKPKDITHWIEEIWLATLQLAADDLLVDNDLAIDGRAISEVEESRLQECGCIMVERHRAIIWLCGEHPIY